MNEKGGYDKMAKALERGALRAEEGGTVYERDA
jgi:hypothetical protein